jgi:hypothetical protein
MIQWNPLVNQEFVLEGDYGHEDGIIKTKFDSGKERTVLKNNYLPMEYPVSLVLDDINPVTNGLTVASMINNTELKQFVKWFEEETRYGTLPFKADIVDAKFFDIVYKMTTMSKYDGIGQVTVKFNVRIEAKTQKDIELLEEYLLISRERKYITVNNNNRIRLRV